MKYWKPIACVLTLAACVTYGYLDIQRAKKSFEPFVNAIDLDKDGKISEQEEIAVYRKLGLPAECRHYRKDHAPILNQLELREAFREYGVEQPLLDF